MAKASIRFKSCQPQPTTPNRPPPAALALATRVGVGRWALALATRVGVGRCALSVASSGMRQACSQHEVAPRLSREGVKYLLEHAPRESLGTCSSRYYCSYRSLHFSRAQCSDFLMVLIWRPVVIVFEILLCPPLPFGEHVSIVGQSVECLHHPLRLPYRVQRQGERACVTPA